MREIEKFVDAKFSAHKKQPALDLFCNGADLKEGQVQDYNSYERILHVRRIYDPEDQKYLNYYRNLGKYHSSIHFIRRALYDRTGVWYKLDHINSVVQEIRQRELEQIDEPD